MKSAIKGLNPNMRNFVESFRTDSPVSFITSYNLENALDYTELDTTLTTCPLTACLLAHRVNQVLCVTRNKAHLHNPDSTTAYWGTPNVAFRDGDFDSRITAFAEYFSQTLLKDIQSDLIDKNHLRKAIAFAHYHLKVRGKIILTLFDPQYLPGQTKRNDIQEFKRLPGGKIQRQNFGSYPKINAFPELTMDDYFEAFSVEGLDVVSNKPLEIPPGFKSPWEGDPVSPYRLLICEK